MELHNKNQPISQWAEDDRPREKLLLKGKNALSSAELMAILIGSGNSEKSAVQLAQEILDTAQNNLIELSKMSVKELMNFNGMGPAKAVSIIAALELGKRRLSETALQRKKVSGSEAVYHYLFPEMTDNYYEIFYILLLDSQNCVIRKVAIGSGGTASVTVDVKKIFKEAIAFNAVSLILAHNHPSNHLKPSKQDEALTEKMVAAGKLLSIQVLDHIIFGNDNYYSFSDEGKIR